MRVRVPGKMIWRPERNQWELVGWSFEGTDEKEKGITEESFNNPEFFDVATEILLGEEKKADPIDPLENRLFQIEWKLETLWNWVKALSENVVYRDQSLEKEAKK